MFFNSDSNRCYQANKGESLIRREERYNKNILAARSKSNGILMLSSEFQFQRVIGSVNVQLFEYLLCCLFDEF